MAYYLSKEEQRRRIIELAQKRGLDCPEMVVEQIDAGLGGVLVIYRCKEGDPPQELRLRAEDAEYIGIDMSLPYNVP